ncbi:MAG: FixH family protein [Hyphomonadaceae bacterium]|nr:FixH family protein [Hyphomonadaceae bacterium]
MIHAQANVAPEASGKELKGWHVLLIMLGFFGVMFAVNGVFLYHAITSFPGEDVKKSYVQGLNYNDTLASRAAQAELGWTAEAGLQDDQLIFRLRDAEGAALSNYTVIGELRRTATRDGDQAIIYTAQADGEYVADAGALAPGQWALRINVLDPAAETVLFNVTKTIIVS